MNNYDLNNLIGRTISHTFCFHFKDRNNKLSTVKFNDDVIDAKFYSWNKIKNMKSLIFEDHYDIIIH